MTWRVRYPGFDVMSQRGHWDAATRKVILDRVHNVPDFQFFTAAQVRTLQAVCDRVMPQDERPADQRIPIAPFIDRRCLEHVTSGTRYEGLPDDWDAWRLGLAGIDETSKALHGKPFAELSSHAQDDVLEQISRGSPPGETWQQMNARRFFFKTLVHQICGIYYAHPTAWDEIGFGGPAYPRGYFALNFGRPEPWEVNEAQ